MIKSNGAALAATALLYLTFPAFASGATLYNHAANDHLFQEEIGDVVYRELESRIESTEPLESYATNPAKEARNRMLVLRFVLGGVFAIPITLIVITISQWILAKLGLLLIAVTGFELLFQVLTIGGLIPEGRPGTGGLLGICWVGVCLGTFSGLAWTNARCVRNAPLLKGITIAFLITFPQTARAYDESIHADLLTTEAALLLHFASHCAEAPSVGGHVQWDGGTDKSWYIVPLCSACNQIEETFAIADGVTLVPANVGETCG